MILSQMVIAALLVSSQATFPPVWDDATYLALKYSNTLEANESVVSQISQDLALIESSFPEFYIEYMDPFLEWEPGQIKCTLTDEGWLEYKAGGLADFRAAKGQFLLITFEEDPTNQTLFMASPSPYHSALLAQEFQSLAGVAACWALGNGGDGNTIEVLELGSESRYLYRWAWGDCYCGCEHKHFREFTISGETVSMTAEWGDLVPNETTSWGKIKAIFR